MAEELMKPAKLRAHLLSQHQDYRDYADSLSNTSSTYLVSLLIIHHTFSRFKKESSKVKQLAHRRKPIGIPEMYY